MIWILESCTFLEFYTGTACTGLYMTSLGGPSMESVEEPVQGNDVQKSTLEDERTAAMELQRHFRGHRTRRNIADLATMAQKFGWWNVVEGVMLENYSSKFYAYNTPQSASQRWLRLKKKAAKVGKGLSKNEKARKLALQHWLEAIDPRHRYGHNLQFYYNEWSKSQTHEPFFYWLDVGEGKDMDLEKCSRSKLQKDLIRYLGPKERKRYEVEIKDGKLYYKMSGELVDTPPGDKWIFVMSTSGKLYIGKKEKGILQHSSFLAGGAATAAGRLNVRGGIIEVIEGHSGHYRPTRENFDDLVGILRTSGADLTVAEVRFMSEDMLSSCSRSARSEEGPEQGETIDAALGIQTEEVNEDLSREVASLELDERNESSDEAVTLMKNTGVDDGRDQSQEVAGREEWVEMKSSLHIQNDKKPTEELTVEVTQARMLPVSSPPVKEGINKVHREKPPRSSLAKTVSLGGHNLYTPAMQAFCRIEGNSGTFADSVGVHRETTTTLSSNSKWILLRSLSVDRQPLVASS